jgi:hypothetical protein
MKRRFALFVLLASLVSLAQDQPVKQPQPCLAVQPHSGPRAFADYVESKNLPMKDIAKTYSKKTLEKLEAQGVRVIVTTGDAVAVRSKSKTENGGNTTETNLTAEAHSSARCQ